MSSKRMPLIAIIIEEIEQYNQVGNNTRTYLNQSPTPTHRTARRSRKRRARDLYVAAQVAVTHIYIIYNRPLITTERSRSRRPVMRRGIPLRNGQRGNLKRKRKTQAGGQPSVRLIDTPKDRRRIAWTDLLSEIPKGSFRYVGYCVTSERRMRIGVSGVINITVSA